MSSSRAHSQTEVIADEVPGRRVRGVRHGCARCERRAQVHRRCVEHVVERVVWVVAAVRVGYMDCSVVRNRNPWEKLSVPGRVVRDEHRRRPDSSLVCGFHEEDIAKVTVRGHTHHVEIPLWAHGGHREHRPPNSRPEEGIRDPRWQIVRHFPRQGRNRRCRSPAHAVVGRDGRPHNEITGEPPIIAAVVVCDNCDAVPRRGNGSLDHVTAGAIEVVNLRDHGRCTPGETCVDRPNHLNLNAGESDEVGIGRVEGSRDPIDGNVVLIEKLRGDSCAGYALNPGSTIVGRFGEDKL